MLEIDDYVGISFWIVTAIMLASTVFFLVERQDVSRKWKTSLTVAALVTGVAFWHYLYMRDAWVELGETPTVLRYVDWFITVPLQVVEFYLIGAAVTIISSIFFWRLLGAALVMLVGGFLGEAGIINEAVGFIIGMIGWAYIIYEIFLGPISKANAQSNNQASQTAFNTIKWIVTIGWAIYPIGYFIGYFGGFENFDALGRWRNDIKGQTVDATSTLFNNQTLAGMNGLKTYLLTNRQDQFARALVFKMSTYALGRPLTFGDRSSVDQITADLRKEGDGLATMIKLIVTSDLFKSR